MMANTDSKDEWPRSRGVVTGLAAYLALLFTWYWLSVSIQQEAAVSFTPPMPQPVVAEPAPDFSAISNIGQRKQAFFDYLLPLIHANNRHIQAQCEAVQDLYREWRRGLPLPPRAIEWLAALAKSYRLDGLPGRDEDWQTLLKRVDEVPASLVLAQAANESAWGTSRFARKANNYFGQWCFTPGCGLVPRRRESGASHEVARFDHAAASVSSYMRNLNSHPAFDRFRELRWQLRRQGSPLEGHRLAEGLVKYSQRGEDYVKELQTMIRYNRLDQYDQEPGDA